MTGRSAVMRGVIRRWDGQGAYGFITATDGTDVYVSRGMVQRSGLDPDDLAAGDAVEFRLVVREGGRRVAYDLRLIDGPGPPGAGPERGLAA